MRVELRGFRDRASLAEWQTYTAFADRQGR